MADQALIPTMPAPPVEPRNTMMSEMPSGGAFSNIDLMIPEELQDALGGDNTLGQSGPAETLPFNVNLAEHLTDSQLTTIADDLCEKVDADLASCKSWDQRIRNGLEAIGLSDYQWTKDETAPFEGASTVVHPMLAEAGVQSQARAVEELFPARGPAKGLVLGTETAELRASADRVSDHMNYQLTIEDPVYGKETHKLHLYNAWFGTSYRKALTDPLTGKNVLRWVKGTDLILPYDATSLDSSPRITHRYTLSENDLKIYQRAGVFRKVEIPDPAEPEKDQGDQAIEGVDGKSASRSTDDKLYTIYETDIWLDLPAPFDDPDGVGVPYVVTLDMDSQTVLRIARNWKETDARKCRRTRYAEYHYLPGLGVKGYGLLHLIGSLGKSGTGVLRSILDAGAFATMQGGFKAKDAGVKAGSIGITPGVWRDIDMTWEDLNKSFYTPPFKEPQPAMFQVLNLLTQMGQRFASTTELQVGEGNNNGPVGTTIALIEQGQKVYSGVHKRGHMALMTELKMLFDLNAENIPPDGYPYKVPGDSKVVYQEDYSEDTVSIVPVSDPNIFSNTQRIAQAQAVQARADAKPQYYKGFVAERRFVEALKIPNPDEILIDPDDVPASDPITENASILTGRPVKVNQDDDDMLHMANHMAFVQHPQFGGIQQAQQTFMPAFMAHMAEHLAQYYIKVQRNLGVPVPPVSFARSPGEGIAANGPQQPQVNNQIAGAAAKMIGQFMQTSGLNVPPPHGAEDEATKAAALRNTDADTFQKFATGAAALVKAATTVPQAEQEIAGMDAAMSGGAGPQPPDGGQGGPPAQGAPPGPAGALPNGAG